MTDYPCRALPREQQCDHAGPGGFMGHTCFKPAVAAGADPGPIEEAYRAKMSALADVLDDYLNGEKTGDDREIGFFLAVFPFQEQGRFNYISNADKLDVRKMLQDLIERIDMRTIAPGTA